VCLCVCVCVCVYDCLFAIVSVHASMMRAPHRPHHVSGFGASASSWVAMYAACLPRPSPPMLRRQPLPQLLLLLSRQLQTLQLRRPRPRLRRARRRR
jgi:hypothetical protein